MENMVKRGEYEKKVRILGGEFVVVVIVGRVKKNLKSNRRKKVKNKERKREEMKMEMLSMKELEKRRRNMREKQNDKDGQKEKRQIERWTYEAI